MHACMHAFVRSFVRSFVHSFIHACMHACMHAFVRSFVHSFIHSFIHACMHACMHAFVRSFVRSFIHLYINTVLTVLFYKQNILLYNKTEGLSTLDRIKRKQNVNFCPNPRPAHTIGSIISCCSGNEPCSSSPLLGEVKAGPKGSGGNQPYTY